MKNFSRIVESDDSKKYFVIEAKVKIVFEGETSGDAGHYADSVLKLLDGAEDDSTTYEIDDVKEISKEEYKKIKNF